MTLPKLREFARRFASVVSPGDRLVVVYSGIWTFGHRLGIPVGQIPQMLIEAMLDQLAPHQTLLLPAYTYAYARTREFTPAESKPETGVLPEAMLRHFKPVRTRSALNSFLAIGPDAERVSAIAGETLWGEGSLKHRFQESHARMVVLGLPWKDACGYLHRIEEICEVPYRYHKTFHGTWNDERGATPWQETMFVRPLSILPVFQWHVVDDLLRARGRIVHGGGDMFMESADASDIIDAGLEILSDDRFALLINRDQVQSWIDKGKDSEIAELRLVESRALDYYDSRTIRRETSSR